MKRAASILILACAACGGGGGGNGDSTLAAPLTAQELLESCVAQDLGNLSGLFDVLLNLAGGEGDSPQPEFNILAALLNGGVVPWTLDIDEDGTDDIEGTVSFRDADGNVTLPFDLGDLLAGGIPNDITELLGDIPDGTTLHLTWDIDGALAAEGDDLAAGSGEFVLGFLGGTISSAAGSTQIRSGDCVFDLDFDDIDLDDFAAGGFPEASGEFDLRVDEQHMLGTVAFDGNNIAEFFASLDGGPGQRIRIDLATGMAVDE